MAETKNKTEIPAELLRDVVNGFLLGADPEFAVLSPPGDAIVMNSGTTAVHAACPTGAIGYDHGGRVWELRPNPAHSAYALTMNIWKLLKSHYLEKVRAFKWKAGALGGKRPWPNPTTGALEIRADTLGGHVHFGLESLSMRQIQVLARITKTLEDLDILPLEEGKTRRALRVQGETGTLYGAFNDVRVPNGHVEYRAPSSWLCNPGQAFACLTTFKLGAARPETCSWATSAESKAEYLKWLERFGARDADALLLKRLIDKRGFTAIQPDPAHDFKPNWRKEDLWAR